MKNRLIRSTMCSIVFLLGLLTSCGHISAEIKAKVHSQTQEEMIIDEMETGEYSETSYLKLTEIYKQLSDEERVRILDAIKNFYPEKSTFELVMFLTIFKDISILENMKNVYERLSEEYLKAQCEIYFVSVNYKTAVFTQKYINRLKKAKSPDEALVYAALPTDCIKIKKTLLEYASKGLIGDASTAERWFGVMSWIDRNEEWISVPGRSYLNERLQKEGLNPIDY